MTKLTHCKTGEVKDMPSLLNVHSANANQNTTRGLKTDWKIRENLSEKLMHTFPARFTDLEIFDILHFAKKYELEAFNIGIKFQKGRQNEFLLAEVTKLKNLSQELYKENERLATILDKHIKGN